MASMSSSLTAGSTREADAKISNDLTILKEKMNLLDSMLRPTDSSAPPLSVKTSEALRSVIGYLDACGPRMIELVTACMSSENGVLSEEVFEDVLGCNDRLQKLLSDVDTRMLTETTASTTVAAKKPPPPSPATGADLADQFGDLLLGNDDPFAEAHGTTTTTVAAGAKTTGETSDDFGDLFGDAKAPPAAAPPAAAPSSVPHDPFDDFFAERTESKF